MPEHSSELSGQSEKVVHLDIDSERFAKLLRFLNDGPEARAGLDWPSLEAIVETSDRYKFDIVPELVARGAVSVLRDNRHTFSEPLSIFRFAAENDFYDLAKFAISFCYATELQDTAHLSQVNCQWFDGVPGRYVAALLCAMATSGDGDDCWDWQLISAKFSVNDEEE
jgi:hypothetical protein